MGIQNTKNFQKFIEKWEISDEKAKDIEQIIEAFSEYIGAVNPEYVYNKTYLNSYVKEFIQCQKALKSKHQLLVRKILIKFMSEGIEKECIITVDGVWRCEKGEIDLTNSIDLYAVQRNRIQIELEWVHDNGFVIAEEINIDEPYDEVLDDCISTFIDRRREVLEDEVQ